jgi:hypothetical protein
VNNVKNKNKKGSNTIIHAKVPNPLEHNQLRRKVHNKMNAAFIRNVQALTFLKTANTNKIAETTKYNFAGLHILVNVEDNDIL